MAAPTTTVSGVIRDTGGAVYPEGTVITFIPSGVDVVGGDVIGLEAVSTEVDASGEISLPLVATATGATGSNLKVKAKLPGDQSSQKLLGYIQVPDTGTADIGTLLVAGAANLSVNHFIEAVDLMASAYDVTPGQIARLFADEGMFGLGATNMSKPDPDDLHDTTLVSALYAIGASTINKPSGWVTGYGILSSTNQARFWIAVNKNREVAVCSYDVSTDTWSDWVTMWSTQNTTVDGSGFILEASPIAYLTGNDLSWNSDVPDATISVTKAATGTYVISGSEGPAASGWQRQHPKGIASLPTHEVDLSWDGVAKELTVLCYAIDYSGPALARGALTDLPDGTADPAFDAGIVSLRLAEFE